MSGSNGNCGEFGNYGSALHPRRVGEKKEMGAPGWVAHFLFYDNVELFAYRDVGVHIL